MLLKELREDIAFYGRQLLKQGLTMHAGGNLSVRDRATGLIAIKPTALPYDRIRPGDVPVIDVNGKIVEGDREPSSEWPMHTMIYRTYPGVRGVVHCHSLYATAFSMANREVPLILHELAVYCSSPVRVAPFENPGSAELAVSAVKYLGDDNGAVLLQSHGQLAAGASLWHAFDCACAVEQAAHMYCIASQLGGAAELPASGLAYLRAIDPLTQPDDGETKIRSV